MPIKALLIPAARESALKIVKGPGFVEILMMCVFALEALSTSPRLPLESSGCQVSILLEDVVLEAHHLF